MTAATVLHDMRYSEKFILGQITEYLKNFGSMNKSNFEVMIFNALLLGEDKDFSDYQISMELGIPISKVKKLRYEAELRYNRKAAADSMSNKLEKLLEEVTYKRDKERIEFYVDNESLRAYINDILIRNHSYADTSFNRGIVSMTFPDLGIIVETLPDGGLVKQRVMEMYVEYEDEMKKQEEENKQPTPAPTYPKLFTLIMLELLRGGNNILETINGYSCFTPTNIIKALKNISPNKLFKNINMLKSI